MMPLLFLDTNPEDVPQLIPPVGLWGESEDIIGAQRRYFILEGDWPEEAFRYYQSRYGPTPTEHHIVVYGETNTDCRSIIAQSFQEPIWERLNRILDEFEVVGYKATLQFIAKYPNVAPLLIHLRRAIRRYFGKADVSLVPKTDPESGNEEIWVYIHTNMPVPVASETLETFDNDFFINIWKSSNRRLCLDLLFV